MDDIIDLELEKIERIMKRFEDPENEGKTCGTQLVGENIQEKRSRSSYRCGGITAEGDMLAALGCATEPKKATEFSEKVHKTVALGAYRSSVEMAKERGAFEIYSNEREQNNPFIQRLGRS